ncbi:UNVERIFIED_CONTAM: hypothetical protein NCL1_14598 [Trichonephila clavipes]
MKEGLIPSRYECPKCKKDMRLVERKGTIDGFEWLCRVQSNKNPHFVRQCVRTGTWFSDSRLSICVILRLTRISGKRKKGRSPTRQLDSAVSKWRRILTEEILQLMKKSY